MTIRNHPVEPEELMAYLDGELSPDRATDAAEHLQECPHCRQLAADLREVSGMLSAWQIEEAELEPADKVVEALKKPGPRKSSAVAGKWRGQMNPLRWPKPAWGLAAVAAIAVLVVTVTVIPKYQRLTGFDESVPQDKAQMESQPTSGARDGLRRAVKVPRVANGALPSSPSAGSSRGTLGKLQTEKEDQIDTDDQDGVESLENEPRVPAVNGPMIIRTAELDLTSKEFDKARSAIEEILKRYHGHVGELNVTTPPGAARSLSGTLRVPSNRLDSVLSDLRGLGRVDEESQGGEEVTQQYVDLQARLANAQHTEQRLVEMLRDRTGKLADVLAVEMQISRVRGEIEQMEAQRKNMKNQVDFATITLTLNEEYEEQLKAVPSSTSTQFRNAAVEGYRSLVNGIIAILVWLLSVGPTLLVWAAILFLPARMAWRRVQDRRNRA